MFFNLGLMTLKLDDQIAYFQDIHVAVNRLHWGKTAVKSFRIKIYFIQMFYIVVTALQSLGI
jgi:hypothetical protein